VSKIDREAVECTWCQAQPAQPCEFTDGPAPMVDDNGVKRRGVHATRYAASLPTPEERSRFWESAIEGYLSKELALMNAAEEEDWG
jgi:hypothetical protein